MDNKPLDESFSGLSLEEQPSASSALTLYDQLVSLIESSSFQKSFNDLPTHSERIKFLLTHETIRLVIVQFVVSSKEIGYSHDEKSVTQASQFGLDGTSAFQAHHYEDALASYSKAIRYAPQDGGLLPLAFGNRSGAYFQLKQYDAALKDIEATETHALYKPFFMLTIRKCQCLVRLGRVVQAKRILDTIKREELNQTDAGLLDYFYRREGELLKDVEKAQDDREMKNKKDFEPEQLKNVASVIKILSEKGRFESQPNNSSLSSKVEVCYDEKNGRHLVTTQEVQFGDILAVTKPYAAVLTERQELRYCHHCLASLKPILNIYPRSIPCTECTRVLYCSEYCRTESWQSYHRFECQILANSFEKSFDEKGSDYRLALRTLHVAGGLDSIRAVTQKLDSSGDPSKSADFTDNPMDYENVYRMKMKDFDCFEESIKTIIRIIFLYKWSKLTEINNTDEATSLSEMDILAIETLFRHFTQIFSNYSIFMRCDQSALDDPTVAFESFFTLDPLIGLVRESCDPNITIHVVDSGRAAPHVSNVCVFFAIKPMPAGTVLSSVIPSYGDALKYRIYLQDFIYMRQEFWHNSVPRHICTCEYCEFKRRESPFGSITTTPDGAELVCCGATCGGLIRRTDDDQVNCFACKRDIGAELPDLKKICLNISKLHSQAIVLIDRIKVLIENENRKTNPKVILALLLHLETLINDRIAPLALVYSRPMLVDLYKQLYGFYHFCYKMLPNKKFDHLQKAWKYAEATHTTMEAHFGGKASLGLLVQLKENVHFFSNTIGELNPAGPMVRGRVLDSRMNFDNNCKDDNRNPRARLVSSFHSAKKRLVSLYEFYNIV